MHDLENQSSVLELYSVFKQWEARTKNSYQGDVSSAVLDQAHTWTMQELYWLPKGNMKKLFVG